MSAGAVVDGEIIAHDETGAAVPDVVYAVARYDWETAILGDFPPGKASIPAVAFGLAIYSRAATGAEIFPGQERLAGDLGLTGRAVRDAIRWLRAEGWLHRVSAGNRRAGRADHFRLTVPPRVLDSGMKVLAELKRTP